MRMRYRATAFAGFAAAALALAACSNSSDSGSASPAPGAGRPASTAGALTEGNSSLGTVLANGKGFTLYTFDEDKGGMSACTGGCAALWPPVTGPAQPAPGVTLPGPLATITRPDGTQQATYNGKPVYTFAQDSAPGQTNGDGFEGTWHAVKVAAAAGGAPAPVPAPSASAGAGGYGY